MHFTYDDKPSCSELMQGDVLQRTPALNAILAEVHPHFYAHSKNLYFMVLTQSCDLVPRHPHGGCKAPYISIAPVRAVDLVVERFVAQNCNPDIKAELPVASTRAKSTTIEFLRRLFNNNEPSYFFLNSDETPLTTDCAAFLNLSIALKTDLHFHTCIEAKILQLAQAFQAKLGWLVGQLYSRVGTTDWEPDQLSSKVRSAVDDAAIWVDDKKLKPLVKLFEAVKGTDPSAVMSKSDIERAASSMKTLKQEVIERASIIIGESLGPDREAEAKKLRRRLDGDANLTALLK